MTSPHRKAVLDFWDGLPQVREDLEKVGRILQGLRGRIPRPLGERLEGPLERLLKRPGKGLRPVLLLQAARYGQLEDRHYTLAAGLELLHLATLVHDDIVDASPLRRGEVSFHARHGTAQGVLYGDLLFSLCFDLVSEGTSPETSRKLARLVTFMAGAEIIQDQDRFSLPVSRRHILKRMAGKTAVLFSLAMAAGAQEAGVTGRNLETFRRLGYHLGLVFQLQDDILDFTGPEDLLGKPMLSDLLQGHFTLPVHLALHLDPSLGPQLLKLKDQPELASTIYRRMESLHVLELCRQMLEHRIRHVKSLAKSLGPGHNGTWNPELMGEVLSRILGRPL